VFSVILLKKLISAMTRYILSVVVCKNSRLYTMIYFDIFWQQNGSFARGRLAGDVRHESSTWN